MLEEPSSVSGLSILSGVSRSDHHIKDFAIQCKVGQNFVDVTNLRLSSGQQATITGNRIAMTAGHEDVKVDFDPVDNCVGVKIKVYSTDADNNNLVLTELIVRKTENPENDGNPVKKV